MSARGEECIRIEECAFHKEVVWDFDFPQNDTCSAVFVDGEQKYVLRLSRWRWPWLLEFSIDLYRMGPACASPEGSVTWWAGLKYPNGDYSYRIRSGSLDLGTECGRQDMGTECGSEDLKKDGWIFQRAVVLKMFEEGEVQKQHLASEGRLTFFLRLRARPNPPVPKTCIHSKTVRAWYHGSVLKEACPLHTEVQWNVSLESSTPNYCYYVSPFFVIGNQHYQLELFSVSDERMDLKLYRLGPSEKGASGSVEWWAGLKRPDGSRYHRNVSGQLDLKAQCQLMQKVATLKRFATDEVHRLYQSQGGEISVFFLLSGGRTSPAADVCTHATTGVSAWGDGSLLMEACPLHTEVQWNVRLESSLPKYCCLVSPEFVIGNQRYRLELIWISDERMDLMLYRLGPSEKGASGSVEWWAGLKRHDGSRYHRNVSGHLDLKAECQLMKKVATLKRYATGELRSWYRWEGGEITVFFLLSSGRTSTAADGCTHGTTGVSAWGDGSVLKEACPLHTEVQWNIRLESSLPKYCYFVSPEFVIGNQHYQLELFSVSDERMDLKLYRLGPSEKGTSGSVEWWAGLQRHDGSRYHRNVSGQLDLKAEWQVMKQLATLKRFATDELHRLRRLEDGNITVFFLLSGGQTSTAANVCTHGASYLLARNDGVIREDDCPSHKEVEWNVCCRLAVEGGRNLASPVFVVGSQQYLLELSFIGDLCLSLSLFRMGPSAGSVRWWAGLKRRDGTYYNKIESKELELKRNCHMWTEVESLKTVTLSELDHLALDGCVTFFLRMSGEKSSDVCNHGVPEMFGRVGDSIREEESPFHRQVEWDFCYEPSPGVLKVTSPLFVHRNQSYMFELCRVDDFLELHLFSRPIIDCNPEVLGYWAGLKCRDGTYNHRMERGKLYLLEDCETWRKVARLKRISQGELEREHLSPDGLVTFFFRANLQPIFPSLDACTRDVVVVPTRGEGIIRSEELSLCTHVEWEFEYPQEHRSVTSPEFGIENQRYLLELSMDLESISLYLYRKGPSCLPDLGKVRCWAGLKRSDGSYYHRSLRGKVRVHEDCKIWTKGKLLYTYTPLEVKRKLLTPCGKLAAFFRLTLWGSSENSDLGPSNLPSQGDGSIREVEGSSCKEVAWTVEPGERWFAASDEFTFEDQRFLFELSLESREYARLTLFRAGLYGSARWWAGLKRADGSYYHRTEAGEVEYRCYKMWRKEQLLKRVALSDLETQHLILDGKLTFFVLFTEATAQSPFLGFAELSAVGAGTIREEECSTHKEVEWQIHAIPQERFWTLSSPEFEIGGQRYLLELSKTSSPDLDLYRMGPSVDGPDRFWAGLKKFDGAYYHWNKRGKMDLKENCVVWRKVKRLCTFLNLYLEKEYFSPSCRVTLFFRLSVERPSTGSEVCIHGSADASTGGDGRIREEECPSHKYVEWEVTWETKKIWTSPSFGVGRQRYLLELRRSVFGSLMNLRLFRMGPFEDGSVRWWVRMNYDYWPQSEKVDLGEECEVWRKVTRLREVRERELTSCGRVTFSICFSLLRSSTSSVEACTHVSRMVSKPRAGSLAEEAWPSYKLVEWDIDCGLTQARGKIFTSPDFSIGNQRFILHLWCGKEYQTVQVFRVGPSEERSAPWILEAKDRAGTYEESKYGKLDLQAAYEIWSVVEHVYLHGTFEPDKRNFLTISFLMSLERTPTATVVGNNDVEALQSSQTLGREYVVFKVQGKEFKVHKAVIRIRVPVLDAMFKYDTLERRTGVVQIEDCDSAVFEIFLKYVVTGELQALPTDENFALYALADKYLMKEFRLRCLRRIEESLSADSFGDVVELIFRYGDDDLLKIASEFLARNKDIVQSDVWQNFRSEYPEAVCNVETEAFQRGS